jgi:16S rRNA (cytidine1402-2'-O)-methyltransferase
MGIIYVVATPMGNLEDITMRAVRILSEVDFIAAEDTRHSQRLLSHFNISTPLIAFHEFNEKEHCSLILKKVAAGAKVALISDAGTPLISDPGYFLIRSAHEQGILVSPIPGPSAVIAALCVSGLPTNAFVFEGFLPAKSKARQNRLMELREEVRTLIFYEAPHRILDLIDDLIQVFGGSREATLAKELTKKFETIRAAQLSELRQWLREDLLRQKGEFVVMVKGQVEPRAGQNLDETEVLSILQSELPLKQAVSLCAKITRQKKNVLYKKALLSSSIKADKL